MGICIDVEKLVRLLGPAKCDYWPKGSDKKNFGLSVSQTLDLIRQCVDVSAGSWGDNERQIRKEFELLMTRLSRLRAAEKLDYQKNLEEEHMWW